MPSAWCLVRNWELVRAGSCAAEAAFVSGARGGDESRDATLRTWRDEVSGHGAARRIKVAQQPASTRPDFVVARSAKERFAGGLARDGNWVVLGCLGCFPEMKRRGRRFPEGRSWKLHLLARREAAVREGTDATDIAPHLLT